MSISAPFIRRPIATSLLMLGVLVFGIGAYNLLPVAAVPNVDFPTITVTAQYPGADPNTMASSVATPLERRFGRIAGLAEMTSSSSLGSTSITLQFDLDKNVDAAAIKVETLNGTVMLSGFAKNSLEKETAERIALKVKGVKQVKNEIAVRP